MTLLLIVAALGFLAGWAAGFLSAAYVIRRFNERNP